MYNSNDTIVARSTPAGFGAISIVRLSGDATKKLIKTSTDLDIELKHKNIYQTNFFDSQHNPLDQVIITFYQAPNSYTGEDLAEINCHGNPNIVQKITDICIENGARMANPGEFTQRRFFNNKIDLTQAEGINEFIHSETKISQKASQQLLQGQVGKAIHDIKQKIIDNISLLELELDFTEEEIESTSPSQIKTNIQDIIESIDSLVETYKYGKLVKNGLQIAIVGPPNCGKSTLLNTLLQEERAITSAQPGTTRDFIEESIEHEGYKLNFIDTAGLRKPSNSIEETGINKAFKLIEQSNLILFLIDPTQSISKHKNFDIKKYTNTFEVINKIDIADNNQINHFTDKLKLENPVLISAKTHTNIDKMCDQIIKWLENKKPSQEDKILTVQRHYNILKDVKQELKDCINTIDLGYTSEFIVTDLRTALDTLDSILGKTTNQDILNNIFSNFCIGK